MLAEQYKYLKNSLFRLVAEEKRAQNTTPSIVRTGREQTRTH